MTEEKPAVKTTIVGGRPPGSGADIGDSPRGMEVLIKKASVDPAFRSRLMEQRSNVAAEIKLELTPAEKSMMDTIPVAQLESIIANTKVNSKLVPILLTGTAAVILAALGVYGITNLTVIQGIKPDIPPNQESFPWWSVGIRYDIPPDQDRPKWWEEIHLIEDDEHIENLDDIDSMGIRLCIEKQMKFIIDKDSDKSPENISPEEE